MTLSIAGRCARTASVGAAISSSSIAVVSRCIWGSPAGIVLSQNITDPNLGLIGLKHLSRGLASKAVLDDLTQVPLSEWRQLAVLDAKGSTAWYNGAQALGTHAAHSGLDCVAAGNMLALQRIPVAMTEAFEQSPDLDLAPRLLAALAAGLAAGGEEGPVHAAGLRVYTGEAWPVVDLRVDWDDTNPLERLETLWSLYEPQMAAYILRSKNPSEAPSFGVPGNL